MKKKSVRVLIIDDSSLVREVLTRVLSADRDIEVVGSAIDPIHAIRKIKELKPDVLTLDLEMPVMDGLTFLEKLMSIYPMPVVVISSMAQEGSEVTLRALELGAVDFVSKPAVGVGKALEDMSYDIVAKVKNAAAANMHEIRRHVRFSRAEKKTLPTKSNYEEKKRQKHHLVSNTDKVIVIGASTGGTVAIRSILSKLPANIPGIVVVLHMPPNFTASYAEGLNSFCRIKVKEAEDRDQLMTGYAYIAPGGKHLLVEKRTNGFILRINSDPPVNRHRPSVDKTFFSVARAASPNSVGIILTGMGGDGAKGLKEMHDCGSLTMAQDEKSSIVFGMPKQAIALGGVDKVLSLEKISDAIIKYIRG